QNIKGDPKIVVPALAKLLKDDNKNVRQAVVQVFWQYGAEAVPHLIAAMEDKEDFIRQQAFWSLNNVQGDLKEALPQLAKLMKNDMAQWRQAVVQIIGRAGEGAYPHLIDALKDKDESVRWTAAMSLRNTGAAPKKAVPILLDLVVKDDSANVRSHAI